VRRSHPRTLDPQCTVVISCPETRIRLEDPVWQALVLFVLIIIQAIRFDSSLTKSTGYTETFINLETVIEIGIIYKPLPPDSRAWLFEIDTHDYEKVISSFVGVRF
jgi:hypothetical protein